MTNQRTALAVRLLYCKSDRELGQSREEADQGLVPQMEEKLIIEGFAHLHIGCNSQVHPYHTIVGCWE
jgi:hypothetical protein